MAPFGLAATGRVLLEILFIETKIIWRPQRKWLGTLDVTDDFLSFIDKFAKKRKKIEYGILFSAWQIYQKNPIVFKEMVRKSQNKKEFLILAGIS